MPAWSAAETRKNYQLSLSPAECARIEAAMAPLGRDAQGLYSADAVFEGGGVLGLAFLGAVRCCADLGIRWHALAGVSAGSITAALVAADLNIDQLEEVIGRLDFNYFLSKKTSKLIFNGDPSNDLENPVLLLTNLAMVRELGQYSTEPARDWLDEALKWAGKPTFGDIWDRSKLSPERQFKVVVSDLTHGTMRVLPDDLEPARDPIHGGPKPYRASLSARQRGFSVAEAVQYSMSIPFFFTPGVLQHPTEGPCLLVDGGLLSNFPLWIYDEDQPGKPPAWPTFGFRLIDRGQQRPAVINSVPDMFGAMFKTMMVASDRRYLSQRHQGRVIDIDLTGLPITPTQFSLSNEQKDELYARGYRSAKSFFLHQWSWQRHLELRGFVA